MTTRRRIASIFMVLGLLSGEGPARAGGVVGSGTPASCTAAAFVQALAGGGTVTFDCGDAPHTIVLPQRQTITADTVIAGGNRISLSGGGANALFTVPTGRTLGLELLVLRDAAVENWAVFVSDDAVLNATGVTVQHCLRGGIYNAGGTVSVTDSAFVENDATSAGAAITNEGGGRLDVLRTVFSGNLNGALFGTGPTSVVDSIFSDNRGDSGGGGAILHNASLHVSRSRFERNDATAGGAMLVSGTVLVEDSVFRRNRATVLDGGAIQLYNQTQTPSGLVVRASTFTENEAGRAGGAVRCDAPAGSCALENATFSRNAASMGAVELSLKSGTLDATHVTVLAGGSPALERVAGTLRLHNSVVEDGTCAGGLTDGGGNVQGAPDLCAPTFATGDAAPFALQDNGGLTPTHELGISSAALGAAATDCLPTDQRGIARPATSCDAGAFERGAIPLPVALLPDRATAGSPPLTMTIQGTSFLRGAWPTIVRWNGTPLDAVVMSPTEIVAIVPAALLATAGTANVTLENPNPPVPDGGPSSISLPFTIDGATVPPPPPPPPAGPCDGLTSHAAVLCALEQARAPGHFCSAADLDPKLGRPLQTALGKAATFVTSARDASGKRSARFLRRARAQLTKLVRRARGKRTGTTSADCKAAITGGIDALATDVAGLGQ